MGGEAKVQASPPPPAPTAGTEGELRQDPYAKSLSDVIPEVKRLGPFFNSGRIPQVTDATIIVLFADVRQFTQYCANLQDQDQDHRIQAFLEDLYSLFVDALLVQRRILQQSTEEDVSKAEQLTYFVPAAFKRLGDGIMIVWEVTRATHQAKKNVAIEVHKYAALLNLVFTNIVLGVGPESPLSDESKRQKRVKFGDDARRLRLGCGLAMGHAWRLDFGVGDLDYAGSVVNLAARLCAVAHPEGVVVQWDYMAAFFEQMVNEGKGKRGHVASEFVKGFGDGVDVWYESTVTDERITPVSASP